MIYTVTFNPSVDYIVGLEKLMPNRVNRTREELIYPGGKGINVSIVLKNLGIEAFNVIEMCESIKVDCVFMTSGSDKAIDTALKYVRDGGKILVFSSTPQNLGYANNEIYYRELTVLGSYSPSPADLKDSLELLKDKKVKVKGLSTDYPLEKVQKAINDTIENKILKAYIKIN